VARSRDSGQRAGHRAEFRPRRTILDGEGQRIAIWVLSRRG
jgi:hypothetical protein